MNRLPTITEKISTRFGSIYLHVAFDDAGRAVELQISAPGKHRDSTIGSTFDAIGEAATELLHQIGGADG
jgi:hypothetical protein